MEKLTKEQSDFFLACADDCLTLLIARDAIQSHPLKGGLNAFLEASLSRLFIVNRVNLVEELLRYWQHLDNHEILKVYFPPRKKGVKGPTNKERMRSLQDAFTREGFEVDTSVFTTYLAFKYLRNFITHGELNEATAVEESGIPTNLQNLNVEHAKDLFRVSSAMIRYILDTKPFRDNELKKTLVEHPEFARYLFFFLAGFNPRWAEVEISDDLGLVRKAHIAKIYWNNLEKILDAVSTESGPLGANSENQPSLAGLAQFVEPAIESWNEYLRLTLEALLIDEGDLLEARTILNNSRDLDTYLNSLPKCEGAEMEKFFEKVNRANVVGMEVSRFFPNTTAVLLFVRRLRVLLQFKPQYRQEARGIAQRTLLTWEVAYNFNMRGKPDEYDRAHIDSYRQTIDNDDCWK